MTRRPIGYYVHHQGAGHWDRARAIASVLDRPCTLLGTFDERQGGVGGISLIHLPDDRIAGFDGIDGESERPHAFHYAPIGSAAIRIRMARIAAWIEAHDPALMIVDVSVEVTLLARLLSVPTLVVRLAGQRTDTPHLEAFRAAEALLAPFPLALETAGLPGWVLDKTLYMGLLTVPFPTGITGENAAKIVVLFGRGGTPGRVSVLAEAARALPHHLWHVLGPTDEPDGEQPRNLHLHGWVDDIAVQLADAALVIGSGGDGVLAAVAALGKRFICIPEPRPFDEQRLKADALQRYGAAILHQGWNTGIDWRALVGAGLALDPGIIASLADPEALHGAADAIEALARRMEDRRR